MMLKIAVVALGGAIGAVCRLFVSEYVNDKIASVIPYGTIVVNLIGAFLIGFFMIYFFGVLNLPQWSKLLLITGCLGGLTTFSTFTYEWIGLIESAHYLESFVYGIVQIISGLALCYLGMIAARLFI